LKSFFHDKQEFFSKSGGLIMDSLTQITLGAAVGEVLLGKKIGNRAMLWGAIGGTIPDLDVFTNLFLSEIDALAQHRGISHSIFFSLLAPWPIGWLVYQLYEGGLYRSRYYKAFVTLLNSGVLIFITLGILMLFKGAEPFVFIFSVFLGILICILLLLALYKNYYKPPPNPIHTSFSNWYFLFFLAFFTHIGLDCFTTYGTQIFQPFSDYRVAFNTISVVDPLYTVPFLVCVIIAAFLKRDRPARKKINMLGLILSSGYLTFTVFHKRSVDRTFSEALNHRELVVERCRTNPTIFNNILWTCLAETDTSYYLGLYSVFDSNPNLHYLNVIPKNHELLQDERKDRTVDILEWFSDGYYTVEKEGQGAYLLTDLRFGAQKDTITSSDAFVFNFRLTEDEKGKLQMSQQRNRPENVSKAFSDLFTRIKGY
jgi:inner membrane protein